jgi:5-methylthioadenosine/S-adenosylhomocysteine deaminase
MFETMKIASLIQKGVTLNPTALPAHETLKMATINGAKALKWDKHIGSIEVGKKADIIAVELGKPHLTPIYSEQSHLVYAVRCGDVKHVIIDGEIVMENRSIKTLREEEVIREAEKAKEELINRLSGEVKR